MKIKGIFPTGISRQKAGEAGMAATLILLLIGYFSGDNAFFVLAIPALVIAMAVPMFYYPFAVVWYGLSGILGNIMSTIVLLLMYFLFVFPVAAIRRLMGKDILQLRQFKKGNISVMSTRDHEYCSKDLENPF
ncbi:MAG: hypothetical protein KKA07_12330 [Bacteroidetes bacterium]|nr:hypothetical protein [Bacteroidota bacterium]MBU1719845.1 hypothetical protein [Bacteroidota bacterium]